MEYVVLDNYNNFCRTHKIAGYICGKCGKEFEECKCKNVLCKLTEEKDKLYWIEYDDTRYNFVLFITIKDVVYRVNPKYIKLKLKRRV